MKLLCMLGRHSWTHVVEVRKYTAIFEFSALYVDESYAVCSCGKTREAECVDRLTLPLICEIPPQPWGNTHA